MQVDLIPRKLAEVTSMEVGGNNFHGSRWKRQWNWTQKPNSVEDRARDGQSMSVYCSQHYVTGVNCITKLLAVVFSNFRSCQT